MTLIVYTMMCEQSGPELVRDVTSPNRPALTSRSSATTTSVAGSPWLDAAAKTVGEQAVFG